ncbi:hypothetical protein FTV88_1979 [Heliorestis convoluta]|uniref:Uncharacterized protein n=1 Tax=Heliorestis convoluta TaxID=356322 RepID=A0A5Q2MZG8_9FIRM|nr:hypothetical protein FTV88_1979 [Heliorestis convoluta]
MDLQAEDSQGNRYDVEIQLKNRYDMGQEKKRSQYYVDVVFVSKRKRCHSQGGRRNGSA